MGILESLLDRIPGEVRIRVEIRDRLVAEILVEKKCVIVDVKNPILAVEAVLRQLRHGQVRSNTLERLKDSGFCVKVRFAGIEFEL